MASLQTRLALVIGGGIVLLLTVASIAVFQLKTHLHEYHQLLEVQVVQAQQINQLNFKFKVQVQEWKNLLLRGKDPEKYQKYWNEFERLHHEIQQQGADLLTQLNQGEPASLLQNFLQIYENILAKYQEGAKVFSASGFDASAGDKAVAGIDREPSNILAQAAELLDKSARETKQEIRSSSQNVVLWSESLIILSGLFVGLFVWLSLKRGFVLPLESINQHLTALTQGNFKNRLQLNQQGEIGHLNTNLDLLQQSILDMLTTLKNSSTTLTSSSIQLNQTAKQIAKATQDTHTSTDQMATALHQMSSTVQEVANNASNAADAANVADSSARKGLVVMEGTIKSINELSSEMDNVSSAMNRLETETGRIGSVLDVIKSVADQTNLLALNAAIEAARAGEQGRGFAVVADEVRSLAKRTQESTAQIQQIIEAVQNGANTAMQAMHSSQTKTQNTIEMANQAGQAINAITTAVTRIQTMNTEIATAAEEQSYAAEEINRHVVRIVSLVENTNEQAQQSTQIAQSLDNSSNQLERQIACFKV